MCAAICIVCRDGLDLIQDRKNPSGAGAGDGAGDGGQGQRHYGAKICTTSCGHVMHVQCVYIWWKTITEQVMSQGNVVGIGFGVGFGDQNPAPVTYTCPLCGRVQGNPCVFELFLTFDSVSRTGNGSGEKQALMRQIEELTAKNVELSKHYDDLLRQERERDLQAAARRRGRGRGRPMQQ